MLLLPSIECQSAGGSVASYRPWPHSPRACLAARLAGEGFTTLVIAYSKRTTGAVIQNEPVRKILEQIVVDGWRILQENPKVDAVNSAVIGFSLGGYFAMCIATTVNEFEPKAVALYYGMYALAGSSLRYLRAPLLILQGENDYGDFVANARRVHELSTRDEKPWEVVMYPNTGHQFDLFEFGGAAASDAWKRTVSFLNRHLRP